ncbi:SNF2-related protein [Zhongshania aliphaticivorans]|uniref:SNF2-related protein n=1 Tax=Zhongshania aliphaticivorans TaxID=1470434 RepID=UPI0012E456B7|nr:SNF2-related protein [Zhongshania aliphaticivorans]CAA0112763.1 RNA polymerase-associated protein RapA [Zhongshania aliphaticivorans]
MFTKHQSAYFAHWLTQTGKLQNQVSRVMASARVDMNPHQVEAACFALKSPIEKGVLLADEVGLGKTIEASLVIAQKWAEHKRKILLIVPASLRKQWNQELLDKFELPSTIVDSKIARDLKKTGVSNPFDQDGQVIISSYEYVALQKDRVQLITWDLVVFDEAHKLRNVYQKKGSKRAKSIVEATQEAASRVLLSATPIQNNLMELYGLSQVIDPHFFGDEKSFKILYVNRQKNNTALLDLKQRIQPLCHRTLRRQVQQEGGINFTNRYALTEDFTPTAEEWDLYQQLSEYLQAPDNQAINPQAKHLVSIGLRKILASSSFAVAETLKGMVQRLRDKHLLDEESLADLEDSDDWRDNDFGDSASSSSHKADKLRLEIELLNSFKELAEGIKTNAKGEALLKVLNKAMEMTENLGGQKKAVIFTESCRTQQYLNDLLNNNGYQGRTVILNGSNADGDSQNIYKAWIEKHQNSVRISGSKPSDMKAALVEKFKSNEADILISTEAGGEGINLQFCSVLINYDLPWNPQKVEQRIGRVHRYGQKNDVVVVNFVNRKNPADQRVFQLLNEKLKLFEGVFGASDEVLGAISSSIDIEQRIYQIYQQCRSDEEIEQQFDQLQEDMREALEVREALARESLMSNFDRDVVATLKNTRDSSHDFLQEYERVLLDLAKAELPEAKIATNHFFYDNRRFDLSWPLAQQNDSEFFRLQATEHFLAWDLVRRAKAHPLTTVHLEFQYGQLEGNYAALKALAGQSGELAVFNLSFSYNLGKANSSQLFIVAQTDAGVVLSQENAAHLLCIPAQERALDTSINEQVLIEKMDEVVEKQKLLKEDELDNYLEQESGKLERWAQDKRKALMETVDDLDEQIRQFKKDARQLASTKEKIEAKKSLRKLERKRDDALTEYHRAKKDIEQEEDKLLDEVSAKLELSCSLTQLFSARWTLKL